MRLFGTRPMYRAIHGLMAALLCAGAVTMLAGCAGELPNKNRPTTSTAPGGVITSTTESQTVQLSTQVSSSWAEAVQKLVPLITDTPSADSIETQVADLKEQYVQKMVALGRQIIKLDAEDQQTIYDRAQDQMSVMGDTDWFVSYKDLYSRYEALSDDKSQEFTILLSTFNTLSQYAFFNVLKTNDPDEAARLGIQ